MEGRKVEASMWKHNALSGVGLLLLLNPGMQWPEEELRGAEGLAAAEGTSLRWLPRARLAGRQENVEGCLNANACVPQEFAGILQRASGCQCISGSGCHSRTCVIP